MSIVHLTKENFEAEAKESKTPVLVDLFAGWCGPCQMMAPVFEELSSEFEGTLKFAKIDTEAEPELAQRFNVMSIPTLLFLVKGEEKERLVGFQPKDALKAKVEEILSKL
jgi:thioredoxin 1